MQALQKTELLGPDILPTCMSGAVARCRSTDNDSIMVHAWRCNIICSSSSSEIPEQRLSRSMDSTKQPNSETWSFRWFKFLRVLPLGITKVNCLCYKSQWRPGLATPNTEWSLRWFVPHLEFSSKSGYHCSVVHRPVLIRTDALSIFLGRTSETVFQKACVQKLFFIVV